MPTRRSAKQNLTSIITFGLIGILVVFFFVFKPLTGQLDSLRKTLEENRTAYNRLVAEETSYRTAQSDFAKIKNGVDEINSLFPPREGLVRNIEMIEAAASDFEDEFSLSITDAKEDESLQSTKNTYVPPPYNVVPGLVNIEVIPYDFTVKGTFLGAVKFLQMLEHQPFFSEIESFSLNTVYSSDNLQSSKSLQRTGLVTARIIAAFYADQKPVAK
jgi:hypothetical protein